MLLTVAVLPTDKNKSHKNVECLDDNDDKSHYEEVIPLHALAAARSHQKTSPQRFDAKFVLRAISLEIIIA